MNLEEKQARLNELKRIVYPSDQELEEMEQLKEEIKLISNEAKPSIHETRTEHFSGVKSDEINQTTKQEPPKKPSLIKKLLFIKQKEPPKPVTQTELDQLTMEAKKQEILSRIAKAKAEQNKAKASGPSIFDTIQKVIGKSNNNPFDVSSPKKRSDYDPFRW